MKNYPKETAHQDTRVEAVASKGNILDRVAEADYDNDRAYEGCTRSVLDALQTHLHLKYDCKAYRTVLKASTVLTARMARVGGISGALTGTIMVVSLVNGIQRLNDIERYMRAMKTAMEGSERSKSNYDTVKCFEIQEKLFENHYDFQNPEEGEAWYRNDGLNGGPSVCAVAARIEAEVILAIRKTPNKDER